MRDGALECRRPGGFGTACFSEDDGGLSFVRRASGSGFCFDAELRGCSDRIAQG